jgi:hypothetical protein
MSKALYFQRPLGLSRGSPNDTKSKRMIARYFASAVNKRAPSQHWPTTNFWLCHWWPAPLYFVIVIFQRTTFDSWPKPKSSSAVGGGRARLQDALRPDSLPLSFCLSLTLFRSLRTDVRGGLHDVWHKTKQKTTLNLLPTLY